MEKVTETLARLQQKAREQEARTSPSLLPDRHPVRDFFVADVLDWALKADRHSMEHPMFSLSKTPDRTERHYEHQGRSVTIMPSSRGLATIWDKDILLYCISVLVDGLNRGRDTSRVVRLKAYDLLLPSARVLLAQSGQDACSSRMGYRSSHTR